MSKITCFQHIDCEGPGTLLNTLQSKNIQVEILKTYKGDAVPDSLGDGLVVLGGPMGVYEEKKYPWMTAELNAIRASLEHGRPVLGICLGSQMIAHAAGAQVYRGAIPEVGWYPIQLTPEGRLNSLLQGIPQEFNAFHWHGDTFTLPPNAVRLAGSHYYPHQIYRIGQNAFGFQCHLEVTEEMVKSWSSFYAKEFTPQGGPIRPERVENQMAENIKQLEAIAEKVFTRFAALL
jgi:GMP synthase-like glutamine amidotransferase